MTTLELPRRAGERPRTGPEVPHVQLSQNVPPEITDELKSWMSTALDGAVIKPSEISEPGSLAFFVNGAPGAVLLPPRLDAEFVHVHRDGSLHMALSAGDQASLIDAGWGERHPLYGPVVNVVMLYGPRDRDELEIAKKVVLAAHRYATTG
ncbi:hypothetical protein EV193_104500 [Herbihabitans rhizosphaerae]|uniref:Luciferase domain-containing protein n=1 Tax=Herbihabitans rhizosphaerae TaxID=1872711 RepID=A0A4V2ESZ4_9PSEU|nr:luciferase family protein [Herbihabitans rhizosphaerae]RZS39283.1 hypothetical protein EV193_104500 [Herbihabitans rhizosphaerae]